MTLTLLLLVCFLASTHGFVRSFGSRVALTSTPPLALQLFVLQMSDEKGDEQAVTEMNLEQIFDAADKGETLETTGSKTSTDSDSSQVRLILNTGIVM